MSNEVSHGLHIIGPEGWAKTQHELCGTGGSQWRAQCGQQRTHQHRGVVAQRHWVSRTGRLDHTLYAAETLFQLGKYKKKNMKVIQKIYSLDINLKRIIQSGEAYCSKKIFGRGLTIIMNQVRVINSSRLAALSGHVKGQDQDQPIQWSTSSTGCARPTLSHTNPKKGRRCLDPVNLHLTVLCGYPGCVFWKYTRPKRTHSVLAWYGFRK